MHPSGSLIKSAIECVRQLTSEATLDAKYSNPYLVRTVLGSAFADVYGRAILTMDPPVVIRHQLDLVEGQEYYNLPPSMQSVLGLRRTDDVGDLETDWKPRNELHPFGPGWALDGPTIRFNPFPSATETWHLWYIPSGQVSIHYAEDGVAGSLTDVTTITLSDSPLLGNAARLENELDGQILRVLGDGVHYERVISSYSASDRVVTLRTPIPSVPAAGGSGPPTPAPLIYEVVPAGFTLLWKPAACCAALELGVGRKISQDHKESIKEQYRVSIKTARDTLSNLMGRRGHGVEKLTIDNPELTFGYLPVGRRTV